MSRTKPRLLAPLLALLLGVAVCITASPASAQSVDRPDPRRDVSRIDQNTGEGTAAPGRTNGDIVRTVFRHKKHRIRIRIGFVDLKRSFGALFIDVFVNTNEGVHREGVIAVDREDSGDPWRGVSWLDNGDEQLRCNVHHSLDYQHNVAILGVPRRCLSHPRWVRIGADARTWPPYPSDPDAVFYGFEDNALQRNGADMPDEPPYSRRLFRG